MNSTITFPPPEPMLKLPRQSSERWAATLAEERRRLQEDQDALREREQNLRDYESRLRGLQAEIEAGRSRSAGTPPAATLTGRATGTSFLRPFSLSPFVDDPALQSAWEKLHRSREILEAEQKNLRDDRIAMRELELQLKRREDVATLRETKLTEREALFAAASPAARPMLNARTMSTMTKLTQAPFNMARSVFRGKKK